MGPIKYGRGELATCGCELFIAGVPFLVASRKISTTLGRNPGQSPRKSLANPLSSVSLTPMRITTPHRIAWSTAFLVALLSLPALRAQSSPPVDPKSVPVIDGGIGPCSADFTITDATGAAVYDAKIRVHIAYGFLYLRKLDLEVGTNADGKARFTGLPDRTKQGLFFRASEGGRDGSAFVDRAKTCKADLTIPLEKKSQ